MLRPLLAPTVPNLEEYYSKNYLVFSVCDFYIYIALQLLVQLKEFLE